MYAKRYDDWEFEILVNELERLKEKQKQSQHGVAVWMHRRVADAITGCEPIKRENNSVECQIKEDYTDTNLCTDYNRT